MDCRRCWVFGGRPTEEYLFVSLRLRGRSLLEFDLYFGIMGDQKMWFLEPLCS